MKVTGTYIYETLLSLQHKSIKLDWALLPVWPIFAQLIYKGIKKYEYRKKNPRSGVDIFIIYETRPISMITGYFIKKCIFANSPNHIWEITKSYAGIKEKNFFNYFAANQHAYAIEIGNTEKFFTPIPLKNLNLPTPQSMRYI